MSKKYLIGITGILLVGFFAGVWQYLETIKLETVSAVTVGTPDPGHTWSSMECSATTMCIDTSGKVGIGTNTPAQLLSVNGVISGQSSAGAGDVLLIGNDSKFTDINVANTAGLFGLQDSTQAGIKLGSAGPTIYGLIDNVGIGTTTPTSKLDVNGSIRSTSSTYINNVSPTIFLQDTDHRSGAIHQNSNLMYFLSGSGVNGASWTINGSYWPLYLNMLDDSAVFGGPAYFMEGNVGIGTTSPGAKLDVVGTIKMCDAGGECGILQTECYNGSNTCYIKYDPN